MVEMDAARRAAKRLETGLRQNALRIAAALLPPCKRCGEEVTEETRSDRADLDGEYHRECATWIAVS